MQVRDSPVISNNNNSEYVFLLRYFSSSTIFFICSTANPVPYLFYPPRTVFRLDIRKQNIPLLDDKMHIQRPVEFSMHVLETARLLRLLVGIGALECLVLLLLLLLLLF